MKTSFAWVTKLSVNTVFQFGPGVKHNTSKTAQYIKNTYKLLTQRKDIILTKRTRPARRILNIQKFKNNGG